MGTPIKIDKEAVTLRPAKLEDVDKMFQMFEAEHWAVGKDEITCWIKGFPDLFLVGEYDGKVIGCINVQNLSADHAYVGNYVIDEPYRHQGVGKLIWATQVAKAGSRGLLLTSEEHNYPMYARMGFQTDKGAPINRYLGGELRSSDPIDGVTVEKVTKNRINAIIQYDTIVTSLKRADYVTKWLLCDQTTSLVAISNDQVVGYAVTCHYKDNYYRIGPLFADSVDIAKTLAGEIVRIAPSGATFTFDADPTDSRLHQLISNFSHLVKGSLPFVYIYTKTDIPVDKEKAFFYSQLTLTRT